MGSEDSLVCEIKQYDGGSYGKPYLAKDPQQAIAYAHDYGKSATCSSSPCPPNILIANKRARGMAPRLASQSFSQ